MPTPAPAAAARSRVLYPGLPTNDAPARTLPRPMRASPGTCLPMASTAKICRPRHRCHRPGCEFIASYPYTTRVTFASRQRTLVTRSSPPARSCHRVLCSLSREPLPRRACFLLRHQHDVVLNQLEGSPLREPTFLRLGIIVDFLQTLAAQAEVSSHRDPAVGLMSRTTTSDFLTPNTASLASHASPSGYSAVTSLWCPGASIMRCRWFGRMLCRPSSLSRSPTGP